MRRGPEGFCRASKRGRGAPVGGWLFCAWNGFYLYQAFYTQQGTLVDAKTRVVHK